MEIRSHLTPVDACEAVTKDIVKIANERIADIEDYDSETTSSWAAKGRLCSLHLWILPSSQYSGNSSSQRSVLTGDPIQFIEWQASFTSFIERKNISTAYKLHYFWYVGDPAQKALHGIFFRDDVVAYKDTWNHLNHRYGQPCRESLLMNHKNMWKKGNCAMVAWSQGIVQRNDVTDTHVTHAREDIQPVSMTTAFSKPYQCWSQIRAPRTMKQQPHCLSVWGLRSHLLTPPWLFQYGFPLSEMQVSKSLFMHCLTPKVTQCSLTKRLSIASKPKHIL